MAELRLDSGLAAAAPAGGLVSPGLGLSALQGSSGLLPGDPWADMQHHQHEQHQQQHSLPPAPSLSAAGAVGGAASAVLPRHARLSADDPISDTQRHLMEIMQRFEAGQAIDIDLSRQPVAYSHDVLHNSTPSLDRIFTASNPDIRLDGSVDEDAEFDNIDFGSDGGRVSGDLLSHKSSGGDLASGHAAAAAAHDRPNKHHSGHLAPAKSSLAAPIPSSGASVSSSNRGSVGDADALGALSGSDSQRSLSHSRKLSSNSLHATANAASTAAAADAAARRREEDRAPFTSKSQTISNIQNVFTDTQKIAYVGLCYLCIAHIRKTRLEKFKKAAAAYDKWAEQFMEKLYVTLISFPRSGS
ncbi:hypothetical protein BC831DRAFT_152320 [Entophlyctis helioformis]|nr:hypothetical protein BC831DRAFT_152320 [Entophlyctis helioformis]